MTGFQEPITIYEAIRHIENKEFYTKRGLSRAIENTMKLKTIGTLLFLFLAATGLPAISERDSFEDFREFFIFHGRLDGVILCQP